MAPFRHLSLELRESQEECRGLRWALQEVTAQDEMTHLEQSVAHADSAERPRSLRGARKGDLVS